VASLEQLVESPTLAPRLSYLARPRTAPAVRTVALVEDLEQLEQVGGQAIVLLTRAASAVARSYRLDVALRIAGSVGVAALVLSGSEVAEVTPAAVGLADRVGVALLGAGADVDLAELAIAIGRELSGGADAALLRAHTALRAVQAHPADGRPEAIAERVGAAMGIPITLVSRRPAKGVWAPVRGNGRAEGWLTAQRQEGDLALALDLALSIAAAATRQALDHARAAQSMPLQSRAAVLSELLVAPLAARDAIAHRARALGVTIDGWHVAARLDLEDLTRGADDPVAADHVRLRVTDTAVQALRLGGHEWHGARAGSGVLLICTYATDPGAGSTASVADAVERTMGLLRGELPTTLLHCGVGSAHQGPPGLVSSAAEAKAAAALARSSRRPWTAVSFDSAGLRRGLVEWYASDTSQDAVSTVLAPLVDLGGARSDRLIRTLHVYLDQQGSLTRTAEVLNLHRNAVSYRVNQIFSLLEVDPGSPDDRLLLQLACRARELAS
jgi:DNA-binding PucR family transcriptional regulator